MDCWPASTARESRITGDLKPSTEPRVFSKAPSPGGDCDEEGEEQPVAGEEAPAHGGVGGGGAPADQHLQVVRQFVRGGRRRDDGGAQGVSEIKGGARKNGTDPGGQ